MILAAICGALLVIGLAAFLLNIVMTVGLKGAIGIFLPAKGDPSVLLPPAPDARRVVAPDRAAAVLAPCLSWTTGILSAAILMPSSW